jgi:predicted O-methyltransferase YrrM
MQNDIPCWFDYAPLYEAIARELPEGATFVEVGSWIGHSIAHFAATIKRLGKPCRIVAIDTFQGAPGDAVQTGLATQGGGTFRAAFDETLRLAGVTDLVEVIEGDSAESAKLFGDSSVWGVFIDADHAAESVRRDFAAWQPKIAPGGVFAGHDIDAPSVAAAIPQPYVIAGRCWVKQ